MIRRILLIGVIFCISVFSVKAQKWSIDSLHYIELFDFLTTKIVTEKGAGTGFFFSYKLNDTSYYDVLVTNNHVVKGAKSGWVTIHTLDESKFVDLDKAERVRISDFENQWVSHPDDNVDLCIMQLSGVRNHFKERNLDPYYQGVNPNFIPSDSLLKDLSSLEPILMVGYPIGLSDEAHNLPIFRMGSTASHPAVNFNNKEEVLVDIASFPGSSGSPVYIYDVDGYKPRGGKYFLADQYRIIFLGILYAGPQFLANGKLQKLEIPTSFSGQTQTMIPTNLGMVIRSKMIYGFDSVIRDWAKGDQENIYHYKIHKKKKK